MVEIRPPCEGRKFMRGRKLGGRSRRDEVGGTKNRPNETQSFGYLLVT